MPRWVWIVVGLNAALQLPLAATGHTHFMPYMLVVPYAELVLLLAALARWPSAGRVVLTAGVTLLWAVELQRGIGLMLTHRDPLLYDQLFLLRHLLVLLADLGQLGPAAAGAAALLALAAGGSWWLSGRLVEPVSALSARTWTRGAGVLVAGGVIAALIGEALPVRWVGPGLLANGVESAQVWAQTQRTITTSPYGDLAAVELTERPDVRLFVVESYGRLLAEHPDSAEGWRGDLAALEADLAAEGWHSASAFCTAPVSGGRSWMADATFFLGTRIRYESVFRHVIEHIDKVPSLPAFFRQQGYHTVLLAPKDRARPGVQLENHFRFQTTLFYEEMGYRGPHIGWGWIPDQYSLGRAQQDTLSRIDAPVFLSFHMVSSHAPWSPLPELVGDWRDLDAVEAEAEDWVLEDVSASRAVQKQLRRYTRGWGAIRRRSQGTLESLTLEKYHQAIRYDLAVIRQHMLDAQPDGLVIIMGDHQPPVIHRAARSFDVPVHLLARDPAVLDEFLDQGFTPGLAPPADQDAAVRHEGMFSLFARALARCCSDSPLPAYHPRGSTP